MLYYRRAAPSSSQTATVSIILSDERRFLIISISSFFIEMSYYLRGTFDSFEAAILSISAFHTASAASAYLSGQQAARYTPLSRYATPITFYRE
jgi:hypothetical protein